VSSNLSQTRREPPHTGDGPLDDKQARPDGRPYELHTNYLFLPVQRDLSLHGGAAEKTCGPDHPGVIDTGLAIDEHAADDAGATEDTGVARDVGLAIHYGVLVYPGVTVDHGLAGYDSIAGDNSVVTNVGFSVHSGLTVDATIVIDLGSLEDLGFRAYVRSIGHLSGISDPSSSIGVLVRWYCIVGSGELVHGGGHEDHPTLRKP
jgi:hypothetical protein